MPHDPVHEAELRAMRRLGWTASDLFGATLAYGDVGTVDDVRQHLATGDHLAPRQKAYIAAALWDAGIDLVAREALLAADGVEPVVPPAPTPMPMPAPAPAVRGAGRLLDLLLRRPHPAAATGRRSRAISRQRTGGLPPG